MNDKKYLESWTQTRDQTEEEVPVGAAPCRKARSSCLGDSLSKGGGFETEGNHVALPRLSW